MGEATDIVTGFGEWLATVNPDIEFNSGAYSSLRLR